MINYQDELTHISLFAGIGGDTLAAQWAGFKTILFVENDKFCQKVLKKHWPDVSLIGDIRDVTRETIANAQSEHSYGFKDNPQDSQRSQEISELGNSSGQTNDRERRTDTVSPITLITGGFPCQPVSVAGKQRGKEDDRWLWPEMLRVIKEVRPKWVVAENVAGLIRMGIDDCISDLENIGYTTEPYLIPACAVNAPHRRNRVFIVGYAKHSGSRYRLSVNQIRQTDDQGRKGFSQPKPCQRSQDVADTSRDRLERTVQAGNSRYQAGAIIKGCEATRGTCQNGWSQWAVEPDVGRVAYGIPSRVDRLKALGNAIVPQQIYPILKAIADLELKA